MKFCGFSYLNRSPYGKGGTARSHVFSAFERCAYCSTETLPSRNIVCLGETWVLWDTASRLRNSLFVSGQTFSLADAKFRLGRNPKKACIHDCLIIFLASKRISAILVTMSFHAIHMDAHCYAYTFD